MKKVLYIALISLLAACTGVSEEKSIDKHDLLVQYKEQMFDLKQKINSLEKELQAGKKKEFVNVAVTKIESGLFEHFIEVTGKVEADQEVDVSPEGSGKIIEIVVSEGERVTKGAVLATLNTDIIDQTIEELKINLDLAKTTFERQENLWNQKIGSELQYLQAKTSKDVLERKLNSLVAQREMTIIKSPVDGIVDVIFQKEGQIASPQMAFAKVVNIDNVKVYAEVSESFLTKLKKGDEVIIDFPAIGKSKVTDISMMGNFINPNNRTFRIKATLKNSDNMIKPNMLSVVKIRDYFAEDAIVIPSLLVKEDFKGEYTFIAKKDGDDFIVDKIYIKSGVSDNNMTEIVEGLKVDDLIINEGFNQVVSGSHIKF